MVVLAIGKCLGALMDVSSWTELGLLTGTRDRLNVHPRLLRALRFGDDDYQGAVYDVAPWVLGDRGGFGAPTIEARFPNLGIVSDFVKIPDWLAQHEPAIHSQVCNETGDGPSATLPDGTVLDAAETAAGRLGVQEMRRQVDRIRRDYADDPEALIGQVKELVESACKTILGLTGAGPETKQEVPALVTQTLRHLGLHPDSLSSTADSTEAKAVKRIFGGLTAVLQGAAELRNARGTGHGRSGVPLVTPELARLTAGMTLTAVVYLCEAYEASTRGDGADLLADDPVRSHTTPTFHADDSDPVSVRTGVTTGCLITHSTFGDGEIVSVQGSGENRVAEVMFAQDVGRKKLLLRLAPIKVRQLPDPQP